MTLFPSASGERCRVPATAATAAGRDALAERDCAALTDAGQGRRQLLAGTARRCCDHLRPAGGHPRGPRGGAPRPPPPPPPLRGRPGLRRLRGGRHLPPPAAPPPPPPDPPAPPPPP